MLPEIMVFNGWTSLEQLIDHLKSMNEVLSSEFEELQNKVDKLERENEILKENLRSMMEGTDYEQSC